MGKVVRSQVENKIDELKKTLDNYLKNNDADKNLVKANMDLLKEKEALDESIESLKKKELNSRRELKKANDRLNVLTERNIALEADLKAYRESIGMIQELKDNLEKGLTKLSPGTKKYIAE